MTNNIAETRTGVTDVKQFIDGMRTSRDTKMAELNALKTQLKEQNQRLLQVTQERAKIESKNKVNQKKAEEGLGKNWLCTHDHSNILLVQVSEICLTSMSLLTFFLIFASRV